MGGQTPVLSSKVQVIEVEYSLSQCWSDTTVVPMLCVDLSGHKETSVVAWTFITVPQKTWLPTGFKAAFCHSPESAVCM